MCDEWRDDYTAFMEWSLANGYRYDMQRGECTLDRINIDGDAYIRAMEKNLEVLEEALR